jgi:hypothetical protein
MSFRALLTSLQVSSHRDRKLSLGKEQEEGGREAGGAPFKK